MEVQPRAELCRFALLPLPCASSVAITTLHYARPDPQRQILETLRWAANEGGVPGGLGNSGVDSDDDVEVYL